METEEEESPRMYTRTQVINFLKQQRADVQDYLVLTYFFINRITEGPLFDRYKRRLNNIIVNNIKEVSRNLIIAIFKPKADQILAQELSQVRYVSVIYPNIHKGVAPIIVQFFNPRTGLQHRILDFPESETLQLAAILSQYDLLDKLVGYCGDYCYKDSASVNSTSDRVTSLRTLSRNRVQDLPYSETFMQRLFDILLDYLPGDVIKSVVKLGETLMGLSGNSQLAAELVRTYKIWLNSSKYILMSDYLNFVISNFDAINGYLYPFQNLPKCLESLFSNVIQRFLLVFMKEIYHTFDKIKLYDNSAVVYYFQLLRISDTFKNYQSNHYIPAKAWSFLNDQVDRLIATKEVDSTRDQETLDTLYKEVTITIDYTYARAVQYMDPLLKHFNNFDAYSWVLLNENNTPIKFEQVHATFHTLNANLTTCDNCPTLQQEIQFLNSLLTKLPLLEIPSVISRWVLVLKQCQNDQVAMVTDLLQYLLSLPSSYKVTHDLGGKDTFDCTKKFVRMNMTSIKDVDVVDKVEEFFDGYMAEAKRVVGNEFISILVD